MNITKNSKVGQVATKHPLATRVFARHNIDFCCGGGLPLEDVCQKNNLSLSDVIGELNTEINSAHNKNATSYDQFSPEMLIDHILETYHRPLDEELPRLASMTAKVYEVHRDKDPKKLGALLSVFNELKKELEQHMLKEEQILFPMIKSGNSSQANSPIDVMHIEHENAGDALKLIRELTNNFTVPDEACNTWKALWHGLEALEKDLHLHIHLENNILFPKVLGTYKPEE